MQSWRKHERITQIKTAYSIIQNAIKIAVAEHGDTYTWDFQNGADFAEKYIVPYLKIQKTCGEYVIKPISQGCFLNINGTSGTWYKMDNTLANNSGGYDSRYYYNMKLQNGMDLGIWATAKINQTDSYYGKTVMIVFDVNGKDGPTKAGVDVFWFTLRPYNGELQTREGSCDTADTSINSGHGCARLIERNHWEFPDDYPVKKF